MKLIKQILIACCLFGFVSAANAGFVYHHKPAFNFSQLFNSFDRSQSYTYFRSQTFRSGNSPIFRSGNNAFRGWSWNSGSRNWYSNRGNGRYQLPAFLGDHLRHTPVRDDRRISETAGDDRDSPVASVNEPSTVALILCGLAGLVAGRRLTGKK